MSLVKFQIWSKNPEILIIENFWFWQICQKSSKMVPGQDFRNFRFEMQLQTKLENSLGDSGEMVGVIEEIGRNL